MTRFSRPRMRSSLSKSTASPPGKALAAPMMFSTALMRLSTCSITSRSSTSPSRSAVHSTSWTWWSSGKVSVQIW